MSEFCQAQNGEDNIDDIIALRIVLDIDQLDGESDDDFASRGAKLCNHALALARKLPKWSGNLVARSYRKYCETSKSSGHFMTLARQNKFVHPGSYFTAQEGKASRTTSLFQSQTV